MNAPQQLILALAPPPAPTLAGFFPGRNAAALAAVAALLEPSPRDPFVYLFGAAGSGRTHLLEAVRTAAPDVEIADDVDQLSESAQIALFDRYNQTRATGGRFIAAGNRSPAQLTLREDLRTRLGWGLAFELVPLSGDERLAALHAHAADRGMRVPDEIFEYVARRVQRDMGTQVAVLDALDRYSLEHKRALTVRLAREVLALAHP